MGGGSSLSKAEKQEKEFKRYTHMKGIERFVINVYASFPRIDSMRIILTSDFARSSFQNFLASERAEEYYQLYSEVGRLIHKPPNAYQLSKEVETIYDKFFKDKSELQVILNPQLNESILNIIASGDSIADDYTAKVLSILSVIKEETIQMMAREQFNRFLLSKQYKAWRSAESSHAVATTAEDANAAAKTIPTISRQVSFSTTHRKRNRRRESDLSVRAFLSIDTVELGRILGSQSWLNALVAAAEGLPVSFCLSSARKERKGFPLLYVNKSFELLTGFTRKEVIGKNFKFLQCTDTEKHLLQKLSEALKHGKESCVILTNKKRDGKQFKNLVYVKPIFQDNGKYVYVLGFHIDVTKEFDEGESKLRLAEELMEMLPNLILTDDDEEDKNGWCLPML
mmetsp:Transcript_16509/g.14883  ORF Transcript_16509/g.14883 Transcript_16509/m.14883 type:complete len:398 (+) Transcript_16509:85-1278(+)